MNKELVAMIVEGISELESELIEEGLILLLERYKNIVKINNITNELSSTEEQKVTTKIEKINNLLDIFSL